MRAPAEGGLGLERGIDFSSFSPIRSVVFAAKAVGFRLPAVRTPTGPAVERETDNVMFEFFHVNAAKHGVTRVHEVALRPLPPVGDPAPIPTV